MREKILYYISVSYYESSVSKSPTCMFGAKNDSTLEATKSKAMAYVVTVASIIKLEKLEVQNILSLLRSKKL